MRNWILIIWIFSFGNQVNAQDSLDFHIDKAIENLQSIWQQNQTFSSFEDSSNSELFHNLLNYNINQASQSTAYQDQLTALKAELYHKDIGLRAGVSYLENLDPAPDDDNLFYHRRFQAGLTWDILRDGFVAHRYKEKALLEQNRLQSKQLSKESKKHDYLSRFHSIIFLFNQIKADILNNRQNILDQQLVYARELYSSKLLKREELLSIEAKLSEIEAMRNIFGAYNNQLEPDYKANISYADNIPVFDINYSLLLDDFRKAFQDSSGKSMSSDLLKYQTSVIHDIQLRTFFRYNWYDIVSTTANNRSFLSFGLNASIPIPFNHKLKQDIAKAQFDLEKYKGEELLTDVQKELINDAYEYRYKLKQYVNQYEKRIKFMELLRQERVLLKLDPIDFNPVKALGLIDDILKIDIELLELNQNMYLKLLKLYTKLPYVQSDQLVTPFVIPSPKSHDTELKRGFYLWSSSIKKYSAGFIQEYLNYNDANELIAAINTDPSLDGLRQELSKEIKTAGVDLYWMIGRNKLMQEGNMTNYLERLKMDTAMYAGIHLDIEPHTFDDWKEKKSEYMSTYRDLLNETVDFAKKRNKKVSISVPLHYPVDDMMDILQQVDRVYFMCYENVSSDYLIRKLEPYKGSADKLSIALRTEDFMSRAEMKQKYEELSTAIGVNAFCLHDFHSVYQMDLKNVNRR